MGLVQRLLMISKVVVIFIILSFYSKPVIFFFKLGFYLLIDELTSR